MNVAIADRDPVTRLAGLALEYDASSEQWVHEYFSAEGDAAPKELAEIALSARDLSARVQQGSYDGATVVIVRRGTFDAAFFARHPTVRFIQKIGRWPDGIDLVSAANAGCTVATLPRASLARTAEHALLLMLAAGKAVRRAADRMEQGIVVAGARPQDDVCYNWTGSTTAGLLGETIGLVGVGEVGGELALRLRPFEAKVLYTKRHRLSSEEERFFGVEWAELETLLAVSRYVSLHLPYSSATQHWMDAAKFSKMRTDGYFINLSRGKIVDEAALYAALTSGRLAGAALDVHSVEPAPWDALRRLDNVFVTPHVAGGARSHLLSEIRTIVDNLRNFAKGDKVRFKC